MTDDDLNDQMIDRAYCEMMAATDDAGRRHWCDRLTYYVKQRSPERIQQLEREKGLA
jgi:hypothetical protein